MKKLLSYDPLNKTKVIFESDGSGKIEIHTVEDCTQIIRANRTAQCDDDAKRAGIKNSWYHFARVPNGVLQKWKDELGIDWRKKEDLPKIEQLLRSRDWSYLRVVHKI